MSQRLYLTDSGHYLLPVEHFGKPVDEQLMQFMQKNVTHRLQSSPSRPYGGKGGGKDKGSGGKTAHLFLTFEINDNANAVHNTWAHAAPIGLQMQEEWHAAAQESSGFSFSLSPEHDAKLLDTWNTTAHHSGSCVRDFVDDWIRIEASQ